MSLLDVAVSVVLSRLRREMRIHGRRTPKEANVGSGRLNRCWSAIGFLILCAVLLATRAAAQDGTRVRLTLHLPEETPPTIVVGTLLTVDSQGIELRRADNGRVEHFAAAGVRQVERSLGRRSRKSMVLRGFVAGAISAIVFTTLARVQCPVDCFNYPRSTAAAGGMLGAGGAGIGLLLPRPERWERYQVAWK